MKKSLLTIALMFAVNGASAATIEVTSKGQSAKCPITEVVSESNTQNANDALTLSACGAGRVGITKQVLTDMKMEAAGLMLLMAQGNVELQCQAADIKFPAPNYYSCETLKVTYRLGR